VAISAGSKRNFSRGVFRVPLQAAVMFSAVGEHETGFLLGRTKNGTLTLQDGPDGLDFVLQK